ncbi:MAG TPA: HAMP domain-containing sensor histidine kinase [Acidimicrobiales bacterium]|nr:HAMP domain-containing sensor histidine kinase [Acidimicrobiales bacterium]
MTQSHSAASAVELIATVSHELRQPLASIRGFTEMLLVHWRDFDDSDKQAMLREILQDSVRASRLMDDLLEMSRLEVGKLPLHMSECDMASVLHRSLRNVKTAYPDLDASVTVALPAGSLLRADPFRMEQVVTNIVENACKYATAGSVVIQVGKVEGPRGGCMEVSVSDGGPGIAPEDLPHVTEKFYRGSSGTKRGLGLGLWISRCIVEAHGGQMEVSSGPAGTTMKFLIPLQPVPTTGKLAGS